MEKSKPFIEKAREISGQLFEDLDHRLFNGVEVIREISRKKRKGTCLNANCFYQRYWPF